jgi:hypothetical protein
MMQKRLRQLLVGGVVPAALAVAGSAGAGAATGHGGPSPPAATRQAAHRVGRTSSAGRAALRDGAVGAANRLRERVTPELSLTDHEQYVRHHQRLASLTSSRS